MEHFLLRSRKPIKDSAIRRLPKQFPPATVQFALLGEMNAIIDNGAAFG
jgi:hypothetical protein